jgi:acetylornithine deacetylase/succinyl-diaminopimelate desuccinylase-like protein
MAKVSAKMDPESFRLLEELVQLDTTNIEDPTANRIEKLHHAEAAKLLADRAHGWGLEARIWDARKEMENGEEQFHEPRPNIIVDLNSRKERTFIIICHYDVVPVPEEQLTRWKSPPHKVTLRSDGRMYGRGTNDDIGSGVVTGMEALRKLKNKDRLPVNVRMVICCDEETGGAGGIDAIADHDLALPKESKDRILSGEMAVIPDGSPYVAAGSSGVSFVEISLPQKSSLEQYLRLCEGVAGFHKVAETWVSELVSPPDPSGPVPHPTITGRATLTKVDALCQSGSPRKASLFSVHANSLAANQIPATVTLKFKGEPGQLKALEAMLRGAVHDPFHVNLEKKGDNLVVDVVGRSGHGGYPHRAANPVPESVRLVSEAIRKDLLSEALVSKGEMTLDLRSPPEMEYSQALDIFNNSFRAFELEIPGAKAVVPPGRARSGYFLSPTDARARNVQKLYSEVSGRQVGIYGEYGGTDASALRALTTPSGEPMPAVVFGSMDKDANIHDAEESLDPRYFNEVVQLLIRWIETA